MKIKGYSYSRGGRTIRVKGYTRKGRRKSRKSRR